MFSKPKHAVRKLLSVLVRQFKVKFQLKQLCSLQCTLLDCTLKNSNCPEGETEDKPVHFDSKLREKL